MSWQPEAGYRWLSRSSPLLPAPSVPEELHGSGGAVESWAFLTLPVRASGCPEKPIEGPLSPRTIVCLGDELLCPS